MILMNVIECPLPFRDGNGRTGRILMSYILIGCELINVAIKGISKKDRG